MLFRNYFVIFISFLTSAALAVGSNTSSPSDNDPSSPSKISASSSPRYQPYPPNPSSRAVQAARMQPRSQGTSSSQGQSSKFSISALMGVSTVVGGASGQGVPAPLQPLAVSPQSFPPPAVLPSTISPRLLLPPAAVSSTSSNVNMANSSQQKQNAVVSDFSDPSLDETILTTRLGDLRRALVNPQNCPLLLRVHRSHLSRVVEVFTSANNPLAFSAISLEIHELQNDKNKTGSNKELFEKLLKFLADISDKLTKLSFIDCVITRDYTNSIYNNLKSRKGVFLGNIIEIEFIRAQMSIYSFERTLQLMGCLKELKHITLNIEKVMRLKDENAYRNIETNISAFIKQNLNITKLTLEGGIFNEKIMDRFIENIIKQSTKLNWQELNILETDISHDLIINILEALDKNPQSLTKLEKLSISGVFSAAQFNNLKVSVEQKRDNPHLHILFSNPLLTTAMVVERAAEQVASSLPHLAVAFRDPSYSNIEDMEEDLLRYMEEDLLRYMEEEVHPPRFDCAYQAASSSPQEQNEVDLDFSTPNLEEVVVEAKLQKLRNTLIRLQGRSMKLHLHSDYLSRVAPVVIEEAGTSSSFSSISIALELYQFQMSAGDVKYDNELLLKLLSALSPVLTQLSFIDCYISSEKIHNLYQTMKAESTLLKNIIELKFMETEMSLTAFAIVSPFFIKKLEKLQYLTFNLKKDGRTTEITEKLRENLRNAIKSAVRHSLDIKNTVIFSGDFFDETTMGYLKDILEKRIGKNMNNFPQGLNTAEIELSQRQMHIRRSQQ